MNLRINVTKLFSGFLTAIIAFLLLAPISIGFAAFAALAIIAMTLGIVPMPSGLVGTNYVPSALAKGQAKILSLFQAGELREIDPVTYKQFRRNAEIMMPSHKVLRTREDRTLEAYYTKRTVRSLGTGRSHNPSGVTGDSGVLTPSFITYNDKFSISSKQADNNVFAFDEMFANEVANVLKNFARGNETTATNYLFNNRSAVNNAVAEGTFNAVSNAFEIIEANNGQRAIQITDSAMNENLYGGPLTVFCDTIAYNKFAFLSKQGAENAVNTSFQFEGKTFVKSLYMTAKAATLGYTKGFWIAVPDGTIGVLDWIPKQNREGMIKPPYTYASFSNPIDGLDYALFSTYVAQDSTSVGGYTQDILTQYEFSIDLAFENAPLSTANETTIQAFALV
jgi:hypothetical protein